MAHGLQDASARAGTGGPVSRLLLRSGIGVFWALVIGVVVARGAYFDPRFAQSFSSVAALSRFLHSLFA